MRFVGVFSRTLPVVHGSHFEKPIVVERAWVMKFNPAVCGLCDFGIVINLTLLIIICYLRDVDNNIYLISYYKN